MHAVECVAANAALRNQSEVDTILRGLHSSGYELIFRATAKAMLEKLGRATPDMCAPGVRDLLRSWFGGTRAQYVPERGYIIGDLLIKGESLFLLQPSGSRIVLVEARHHDDERGIEAFSEDVARSSKGLDGRRLRGMDWKWSPVDWDLTMRSRAYTRRAGARTAVLAKNPAKLEPGDVDAAALLTSADARGFLLSLAQLGKQRSADARAAGESEHAELLLKGGLIRGEFLVVCKKDSRTLCTVQTRAELDSATVRCTTCGQSFASEHVQEIYALTDLGRRMLGGSHWMTVWVTSVLVHLGIPLADVSWGATGAEDEVDIIVSIYGQEVFFELKDREFGLGDGYPFSSRLQRYGATQGVIVTTDVVAAEVKRFLADQRTGAVPIVIVEGTDVIEPRLRTLLNSLANGAVRSAFSMFMEPVGLDATPVVSAWLKRS